MTWRALLIGLSALVGTIACAPHTASEEGAGADSNGHVDPSQFTLEHNRAVGLSLPQDQSDFGEARRGLIAAATDVNVVREGGSVSVWRPADYDFENGPPPGSVNPSLWRQAQLTGIRGLFKVTEGVYQLRGFDISNMTLIEGRSGWIVVDPLTTTETAAAALAFARAQLGNHEVSAVVFTHSHVDHFGGIAGIVEGTSEAKIAVVAPKGFLEEATSENLVAGIGMGRRASYMFGTGLPVGPRGHVSSALGMALPQHGHIGILKPTVMIDHTGQELELDGVHFVFQSVPDSEAPDELTFLLPELKGYCGAELLSHTLHNLYTLRGAKVRDGLLWSRYIDAAISGLGETEVFFGSHNWPVWGHERIVAFMSVQRDTYKYIHDQSIRLANLGYTPDQIAERIRLPESLRSGYANRDYYGTLSHDSKGVYQRYFGWYDGNPAHLDPLPPEQSGPKYVEAMGGTDAVISKARAAYDAGEYRWVAELLNHLVFSDPKNRKAAELLASAYDQLAYQAESGPWRDEYLTAADELRHGTITAPPEAADARGLLEDTPPALFFDSMAASLDGPAAAGQSFRINLVFTDLSESHVLTVENGVLRHDQGSPVAAADATVYLTHAVFLDILLHQADLHEVLFSDGLRVEGSRVRLLEFFRLFHRPDGRFNLVRSNAED